MWGIERGKKKKIICTIYSTFNFSQTVGEMVFVSFEVEKTRIFLVQSVVRWCWVFMRSWGAAVSFPVWRMVPISGGQFASLYMQGHWRAAFPILLQSLLLFQILGHRCRIRYKRPSILIPRTTRPHRSLRTVCPLLPVTLPSLQVSLQVSKSN